MPKMKKDMTPEELAIVEKLEEASSNAYRLKWDAQEEFNDAAKAVKKLEKKLRKAQAELDRASTILSITTASCDTAREIENSIVEVDLHELMANALSNMQRFTTDLVNPFSIDPTQLPPRDEKGRFVKADDAAE